MRRIFAAVLLAVACLLGGCGTDITCSVDDILKNMVSLSSSECKNMYDGKIVRVNGRMTPISNLKTGGILFGIRFSKTGPKSLGAQVKNPASLKGYGQGDEIVLEGKAKYIDEGGKQAILIDDAKVVK